MPPWRLPQSGIVRPCVARGGTGVGVRDVRTTPNLGGQCGYNLTFKLSLALPAKARIASEGTAPFSAIGTMELSRDTAVAAERSQMLG